MNRSTGSLVAAILIIANVPAMYGSTDNIVADFRNLLAVTGVLDGISEIATYQAEYFSPTVQTLL
jgi:hypothetical protein